MFCKRCQWRDRKSTKNILITIIIVIWIQSTGTRTKRKKVKVKKVFEHRIVECFFFLVVFVVGVVIVRGWMSSGDRLVTECLCYMVPVALWLCVCIFFLLLRFSHIELSVLGWIVVLAAVAAFLMWEIYLCSVNVYVCTVFYVFMCINAMLIAII